MEFGSCKKSTSQPEKEHTAGMTQHVRWVQNELYRSYQVQAENALMMAKKAHASRPKPLLCKNVKGEKRVRQVCD